MNLERISPRQGDERGEGIRDLRHYGFNSEMIKHCARDDPDS